MKFESILYKQIEPELNGGGKEIAVKQTFRLMFRHFQTSAAFRDETQWNIKTINIKTKRVGNYGNIPKLFATLFPLPRLSPVSSYRRGRANTDSYSITLSCLTKCTSPRETRKFK